MKQHILAKSINGQPVRNWGATFIYDMFHPDSITIEFDNNPVWHLDINMLRVGGDFGGDIAIIIDDDDTVIALIDSRTGTPTNVVFSTPVVQWFVSQAMLGIDIPIMREAEIDNCIVEFYTWYEQLGMV